MGSAESKPAAGKSRRNSTGRGQKRRNSFSLSRTSHSGPGEDSSDEEVLDEEDHGDDALARLHGSWSPVNAGSGAGDKRGLAKFFKVSKGERWRHRQGWLRPGALGLWYGVFVDQRLGEHMVVGVSLPRNRVRGDFSKTGIEFSKISFLQVLNLSFNKLTGKMPAALGYCEKLKELDLSHNRLTGLVPPFLGNLPELIKVNLAGNFLAGEVNERMVEQFVANKQLQFFDVNNNDLHGEVLDIFGDVTSLVELGLGGNLFTGVVPHQLCCLSNLKRLDLHENALTGELPDHLDQLSALKQLRLHGAKNATVL